MGYLLDLHLLNLSWLLYNLLHHLLLNLLYWLLDLDLLYLHLLDWPGYNPLLCISYISGGYLLFYLCFLGGWVLWQMHKLAE